MTGRLVPPGFAPTGRRLAWHGDDHWEFRRDLVCRCESICDVYAIAMRIGAVPAPGSRGEQVAVMLQHLGARRARRG